MTNTQRMTTADCGAASSKNKVCGYTPHLPASSELGFLIDSTVLPTCQDKDTASRRDRTQYREGAHAKHHGRLTFEEILARVRAGNLSRLKNRAFAANEVAKVTRENRFRKTCYRIKDKAINGLLKYRVATLHTVELSLPEPLIGLAFAGGGKLHTKPSGLDWEAREVLKQQFLMAVHGEPGESRRISRPTQNRLLNQPNSRYGTTFWLGHIEE